MSCFDFQVFMNQEKQIQLLTFVFMKSFGLNGKHCIGVQFDSLFIF